MKNEFIDTIKIGNNRYFIRRLQKSVVVYRKDGFKLYFLSKKQAMNWIRDKQQHRGRT